MMLRASSEHALEQCLFKRFNAFLLCRLNL